MHFLLKVVPDSPGPVAGADVLSVLMRWNKSLRCTTPDSTPTLAAVKAPLITMSVFSKI